MQKLGPCFIPFKSAYEIGCRCDRILFLDAAHRHTQMLCLNDNCHAKGFQRVIDGLLDLHGQPLLDLQPARIDIHHPCNLAQPGDIFIGNVGHMSLPYKRDHVMFA